MRTIRTSGPRTRYELRNALQSLFVAELVSPSEEIFIVTPWISDVEIVDNQANTFSGIDTDLPIGKVRLSTILVRTMLRGGRVVIATRPDPHNKAFTDLIVSQTLKLEIRHLLNIFFASDLHEKGILTSSIYMSGSMNLTHNGLNKLDEKVTLTTDKSEIARTKTELSDRWKN